MMNLMNHHQASNIVLHPSVVAGIERNRAEFLADCLEIAMDVIGDWGLYRNVVHTDDRITSICLRPDAPTFDRFDARDDWHVIDMERIADAIVKIGTGAVEISEDRRDTISEACMESDASMIDADLADCILQVAAFGEIVFG